MPLNAVIFDLGLTLIRTGSFSEIYRQILARFGITVSLDDIVRAQKETENEFDTSVYDESRRKEFWTNYNVSLLEKLGVEENTVFVGDSVVFDYEGALGVGIKLYLIDREGKLPGHYDKIGSLTELLTIV